jgi:DNA-binding beta-propeller fold protein YncE
MRPSALHRPALAACLAAAPLAAQMKICVEPESVLAGQSCVLTFRMGSGPGPVPCDWTLLDRDTGALEPQADGTCRFTASERFLFLSRIARVRAVPRRAPAEAATTSVQLDAGPNRVAFMLVAKTGYLPYPDAMEPSLGLLAGTPFSGGAPEGTPPIPQFPSLGQLAWTGDHPDDKLARQWLVGVPTSCQILAMDGAGVTRPWLGPQDLGYPDLAKHQHLASLDAGVGLTISVRPEGVGAWRAVLVDLWRHRILEVDGQGRVATLAGGRSMPGFQDGDAASARFHRPLGAVVGTDGAVYVADTCNRRIRRIREGAVSTLAGSGEAGLDDGKGTEASFDLPIAITQDPDSGHLYVADRWNAVRQVALDGTVTTLAGSCAPGFEDWKGEPLPPAGPGRMRGIPCFTAIRGLSVARGKLYIADGGNQAVRVLDLASGDLATLAGDPGQQDYRSGRLRAGKEPDPSGCAALLQPQHVAFDDQGHCLVAMNQGGKNHCIVELSMAGLLAEGEAGHLEWKP